jgi:hypothetical protein
MGRHAIGKWRGEVEGSRKITEVGGVEECDGWNITYGKRGVTDGRGLGSEAKRSLVLPKRRTAD